MKVAVDQSKCIAAGQCVLAAADVFDQRDEDGVVVLLDPSPSSGQVAHVKEAVALCPARAITVED